MDLSYLRIDVILVLKWK